LAFSFSLLSPFAGVTIFYRPPMNVCLVAGLERLPFSLFFLLFLFFLFLPVQRKRESDLSFLFFFLLLFFFSLPV